MYERILESAWDTKGNPIRWKVYSSDFKSIIAEHTSFAAAKMVIELEIRQKRTCQSCED